MPGESGRGRPFVKGDPRAGRPKGVPNKAPSASAAYIRAQTREGQELAEYALGVLRDKDAAPASRMDATRWLADRGFGRAREFVEHDTAGNDLSELIRLALSGSLVPSRMTTLTRRQARAIEALCTQPTSADAARAANVGERTLRRWLAEDPSFQGAYREARTETMRQATARLQSVAGEAVTTLQELLKASDRPDVRCRAALGILAAATKAEELENLAARVEALELATNGGDGRKWPRLAGKGRRL
jgi:hypothetical protein